MTLLIRRVFSYSRGAIVLTYNPNNTDAPVGLDFSGPMLLTLTEAHDFGQFYSEFLAFTQGTFTATHTGLGPDLGETSLDGANRHPTFPPTHIERRAAPHDPYDMER